MPQLEFWVLTTALVWRPGGGEDGAMVDPAPMRWQLPIRLTPGGLRLLLFAVPPALAAAVLLSVWLFTPIAAPAVPQQAVQGAAMPPPAGVLIHVTGAVAHPGLYRVHRGDRAYAAIAAAGGLTPDADPERLPDLATPLRDGQQVRVPVRRDTAGATGSRGARISLNQAAADQLAAVPGFTSDLVAAVLEYRSAYGGFQNTRELVTVLGMSEAAYGQARSYVKV
jgi:competence protein ComEA